jgi:hypothetical protein
MSIINDVLIHHQFDMETKAKAKHFAKLNEWEFLGDFEDMLIVELELEATTMH